ncbi:threonine dehydrogenase-like Zn-dependent dehydrogenase [Rhodococcus rhodochrous J45]|uniref:Threonine dehydrogenase-like Zn-dependent dehydrogenase n=1 Tax=Rhodococcus rhodochrous J45 TaxID=935266 RepID=A0A562DH71_RHORH|nr:zinc-binding dehydrogenase [Rhodococcus rhodochrous]TWH08968.1 threonine dehydrogenase-like Zn-dependent dehydrogenase [Rhodococcus rhodochrous J45]
MQGLVFDGDRRVSLRSFPDPKPGEGEIVIRVTASGMCGSDLHYYRAPADSTPDSATACIGGHEPAGVVEELGPGTSSGLAIGDRVMIHHYAGCGQCGACRSGWTQMCTTSAPLVYGKNADGAHAPYMRVAAGSALHLPDALSPEAGAAIGCGTGTAWGALERLGDIGGADVVVSGQGPVGLSATMLAAARGARVIAVDLEPERLAQSSRFGAAETVDAGSVDVAAAIRELTGGSGASAVVETSGATAAAKSAVDALAPWGRLCVVGLGGTVELDVRRYLSRQLTVMTSWSLSSVQQLECAAFIERHKLPVDDLFSDRWSLDQAEEAYIKFDKQDAGKGVFVF